MSEYTVVWWSGERQLLMVETTVVDTPEEAPSDAGVPDGADFLVFDGCPEMLHTAKLPTKGEGNGL